jgi:hypothetical protein
MAETINTQITDALTRRHLRVLRAEARHRQELMGVLAVLEADLLFALKGRDPTEPRLLAWRRRRVAQLIEEDLAPLLEARYDTLDTMTAAFLIALTMQEAIVVRDVVNGTTEEEVLDTPAPPDVLRRRLSTGLFPSIVTATALSATHTDWWQRLQDSFQQRLGDQLMVGVTLEEPLTTIVERVKGTPEQGFQDGLMQKAREEATRLLRTEVTHAVGTAREVLAEVNAGKVVLEHHSILDNRTTIICQGRHGLRFQAEPPHEPIGHSIPYLTGVPYHPACRSSVDPVLVTGGNVQPPGLEAFLHRQSPTTQREILGTGRWKLWQEGKLDQRTLLESGTGRPLRLEELAP